MILGLGAAISIEDGCVAEDMPGHLRNATAAAAARGEEFHEVAALTNIENPD